MTRAELGKELGDTGNKKPHHVNGKVPFTKGPKKIYDLTFSGIDLG